MPKQIRKASHVGLHQLKQIASEMGMTLSEIARAGELSTPTVINAANGKLVTLKTAHKILAGVNAVASSRSQEEVSLSKLMSAKHSK